MFSQHLPSISSDANPQIHFFIKLEGLFFCRLTLVSIDHFILRLTKEDTFLSVERGY